MPPINFGIMGGGQGLFNSTNPWNLGAGQYGGVQSMNLNGVPALPPMPVSASPSNQNVRSGTQQNGRDSYSDIMDQTATDAGGKPGTGSGLGSMATNLLGLATGSAGTSLLGDAVGGIGTMLGSKMMDGLFGSSTSQAESAVDAQVDAANKMIDLTANKKSSLLQNTNSMGQQGPAAALEAQRRMNGQMVGGEAVADKNRILAQGASSQQNALNTANQAMRQNQMGQQNLAKSVMNMRGGSGVANLGALQSMGAQNAQGNIAALGAGTQALNAASQMNMNAAGMASDIFSKDLQSNFTRNVAPALNNWENFQGMATSLGNTAASTAGSIAGDNASYNALGGTAQMLGTRAGIQNGNEQKLNWADSLSRSAFNSQGVSRMA